MRQPAVLAKRRTSLSCGDLDQLSVATVDTAWPGYWFHRRVAARRLRPVCQVSYARMARGGTSDGEPVRLTLDHDLRARPARGASSKRATALAAAADRLILELKYQGASPAVFRRLVEEFALTPQPASKYRLGLAALGKTAVDSQRARRVDPGVLCLSSCGPSCRRRARPLQVLGRLVGAMLLGGVVGWIYQRTRPASETSSSLAMTLVLLSILIAMVTQVIGDNVARAFSLVGALSIVRFRTVVRDTVGHGVRDLCRRRRHGGRREPSLGRAVAASRSSAWRRGS